MLLELARWLQGFARFFALFDYLTMRAILGALTALAFSLWWGPSVIARLVKLKGGQPIRPDGPQSNFEKAFAMLASQKTHAISLATHHERDISLEIDLMNAAGCGTIETINPDTGILDGA